ncbi:UvrD-helicase domain-containing protein [Candidatus Saccharibacteria bacterium]|nr:UvrD-helicase domain-containing protein [Candidatus Saccharibacteria bacterium]
MDILKGLNVPQQDAVRTTDGPVLILAGAGSGKTKALTHRIAYLIAEQGIWPNQILAVTFTNKAAREMRFRLAGLLNENADKRDFMPWMGTFHSVCVRLLRMDGHAIGIRPNFVIYDEDDRRSVIKQAMKSLDVTDKQLKASAASSIISTEKNKLNDPETMLANARFPYQQMIAEVYAEYEKMRRQAQALDFDDLLIEVVRLLRDQPEVRSKWQERFRHILIDEYQDTNAAQYAIVKLLINSDRNICVVGDDWQSIYSWRGADFTNILNFEKDFPGAVVIKLEQNYRSTQAILDAAQQVIAHNKQRTDKLLWTDSGQGAPLQLQGYYSEDEEAAAVADHVSVQVNMGGRGYDDFAVLYRTNAQSFALERAFRQRFIPVQIIGGMRFLDRAEVKDILAYLRLAYQPNDTASFLRIVNTPARGIGAVSVEKFLAWQRTSGMDIVAAMTNAEQTSTITGRAKQALMSLGDMFRIVQVKLEQLPPSEIIEYIYDVSKYRSHIDDGTPKADERIENIGSLVAEAATYVDTQTFLEEVALMSSTDKSADKGQVTLMTLHAAKGLEFPVVHMVGMEEGILPHSRVFDGTPDDIEEERRLCYVGMTRAREELWLSYAASRRLFQQTSYNEPSRFLKEIEGVASISTQPATSSTSHYEDFYSDEMLSDGDRVKSAQFGAGTVSDVDGMAVTIEFDNGTRKKLNVEYARLERL